MCLSRSEVVVVGYEVDLATPIVIVQSGAARGDHEIGGQRQIRRDFGQRIAFRHVERLERVGAEPLEVQQLARVHEVALTDETRRDDLGEVVHPLRPERGAPRVVHLLDRAIAFLAPLSERALGVLGIVEPVVAAVFVAHMPSHHIRVVPVMFGHRTAQSQRVFTEHGAGRSPVLAGARLAHIAALVLPQHLGMRLGEPHRRRSGSGRQIHGDARFAELVDDAVKPAEVIHAPLRLDPCPGENAHGHQVHARLPHQADILIPYVLGPLIRIVIASVPDAVRSARQRLGPTMCSALRHCSPIIP